MLTTVLRYEVGKVLGAMRRTPGRRGAKIGMPPPDRARMAFDERERRLAWNGKGLPPVAARRIERARGSGVRTSLLSVPASVAVESAGLDTVGEVMGCVVQQRVPPMMLTPLSLTVDYRPYVLAWRQGWATALDRLREEAARLGASGVVGIQLTRQPLTDLTEEIVALGTAVRDPAAAARPRPFTTTLPGTDVAKLLAGGWAPVEVIVAVAVTGMYRDYSLQRQTSVFAGNIEVDALTALVTRARSEARRDFANLLRRSGSDGGIVSSMSLEMLPMQETTAGARADILGTGIARTTRSAPAGTLKIMPLGNGRKPG
ncbi:YbjQ family protein [Amycolatopsis acidiphila]|uniref:YbjQ family protein n=1 Tax=Amycolatopsis acidiphila TaxID=715473 RepID=A0A558AGG8_9PSEU|nr:heavy metal-binding domain-containing protein [Amycolatopsis acidiphila]TVT23326.1 YbjQ family protein [Amycolatopsis acidiphila]UIJ56554.1 YbjQ family protein [Amycolatopsis acidiphila]